jgi:hypothetical protein
VRNVYIVRRLRVVPIFALVLRPLACNFNGVAIEVVEHGAAPDLRFESHIKSVELSLNTEIRTDVRYLRHCVRVLVLDCWLEHLGAYVFKEL